MALVRKWAVRFNFPDGGPEYYAGLAGGAFGWAPTLDSALTYDRQEEAERVLANAYGPTARQYGEVVEVEVEEGGDS
jgi:hypothetical protein